ncbi:MAG: F0F1 ATP synthase subunit B [Candidatus Pacebacteria bacterium]|jgi:F-type H+-transporting ATPase subunit b|nr:F0F1 ATP synthase subunit B [Candidatus Paceibacterota bacterium]
MEGLGIDPKILVGDIITFVVLVFILKKYAYKPFLAVLDKRRKEIEEGVKKSEEAEKSLAKIRTLADEVKEAGERKSKEVIQAAEKKAQEKSKAILAAAEEEKGKVVAAARAAMEKEQAQAQAQRQKEAVDLAFAVSEKFLAQKLTKDVDQKLIEKMVAEAN